MKHYTAGEIIRAAEALDMPCKPSVEEMSRLADQLEITYGRLSAMWDDNSIGQQIKSPKAERYRAMMTKREKKQVERINHRCAECGTSLLSERATWCPECAKNRKRERERERKRAERATKIYAS